MLDNKAKEKHSFTLFTMKDIEEMWIRLKIFNLDFRAIEKSNRVAYIKKYRPSANIEALSAHYKNRKAKRISVKSFFAISVKEGEAETTKKFDSPENLIKYIRNSGVDKINITAGYVSSDRYGNKETHTYENWDIVWRKN